MLANVFVPLFLITVVAYLVAMAVQQRSPFSDRDFLVSLNGLLVLVLAMTVLSVAQSSATSRLMVRDVTNMALVGVTLIIDTVALSAIVFRLSAMGVTPNRLAVLGTNLLTFVHLSRLLACYARVVRTRSDSGTMDELTARWMPWYSAWAALVGFAFPLLFRFR